MAGMDTDMATGAEAEIVAVGLLSRTELDSDRHQLVRDLCKAGASRRSESALTGFLLHRASDVFGYVEGAATPVRSLVSEIVRDPDQTLIRHIQLGVQPGRRCPDWELRILEGPRDLEIGLDVPLRSAIAMHSVRGQSTAQHVLISRIVDRIYASWDHSAGMGGYS